MMPLNHTDPRELVGDVHDGIVIFLNCIFFSYIVSVVIRMGGVTSSSATITVEPTWQIWTIVFGTR